jgi:hypothetical protein
VIVLFSGLVPAAAAYGSAGFTTMVWYWFVDLREPEQEARNTSRHKLPAKASSKWEKRERELYGKKSIRFIVNRNTVCNDARTQK